MSLKTLVVILLLVLALGANWLINRSGTPLLPQPPLKTLAAQHRLKLGNFAISKRLNETPYRSILSSQFDFVLVDNTPNWYFNDDGLRPAPNKYNFQKFDEIMEFAREHQMAVQAHHFLWGEAKWLPDWLKNGSYDRRQLLRLIHQHITTVGQRYRGQIAEWTVVNEAFSRGQQIYGLHDWWADHLGGLKYLDPAFRWAHQADPNAKLILNDFGNEAVNDISNAMYDYLKKALDRGVPINGIGMQMHIDGTNPPAKKAVINNMRRFGKLGLQVYVTEFDVNMNDVSGDTETKNQKEATIYYDMLRACIESRVCHSFAILGITDKETWYRYLGATDPRPLPFDENYQPKPAFYAIRQALQQAR